MGIHSGVFRISKRGGQIFAGHYCSHKWGAKPSFPIFFTMSKKNFGPRGPWPIWPRGKYATGNAQHVTCHMSDKVMYEETESHA